MLFILGACYAQALWTQTVSTLHSGPHQSSDRTKTLIKGVICCQSHSGLSWVQTQARVHRLWAEHHHISVLRLPLGKYAADNEQQQKKSSAVPRANTGEVGWMAWSVSAGFHHAWCWSVPLVLCEVSSCSVARGWELSWPVLLKSGAPFYITSLCPCTNPCRWSQSVSSCWPWKSN